MCVKPQFQQTIFTRFRAKKQKEPSRGNFFFSKTTEKNNKKISL